MLTDVDTVASRRSHSTVTAMQLLHTGEVHTCFHKALNVCVEQCIAYRKLRNLSQERRIHATKQPMMQQHDAKQILQRQYVIILAGLINTCI
jgi:hypothetical protein